VGAFIKQLIETLSIMMNQDVSKRRICQIFLLPSTHIKIKDLTISRPLTIKGRPGTILEITHGSIVVDFELGSN
jgi:hypothetical protein